MTAFGTSVPDMLVINDGRGERHVVLEAPALHEHTSWLWVRDFIRGAAVGCPLTATNLRLLASRCTEAALALERAAWPTPDQAAPMNGTGA